MNIQIQPGALRGSVPAPPSKSDAHRCLILAALADGPTKLRVGRWPVASTADERGGAVDALSTDQLSSDIDATIRCLETLGTRIQRADGVLDVMPGALRDGATLDCGDSGATLRFLTPVVAACCKDTVLTGKGRLPERPMGALLTCLSQNGVRFTGDKLPLKVHGGLKPGMFALPGHTSSQFVSGLLMALPLLQGDSVIRLTTPLQSSGYVDMTRNTMRRFSVHSVGTADGYEVPGGQAYRARDGLSVEGDWSSAAFYLAAGALKGTVTLSGLQMDSLQKDKQIVPLLERFGAVVTMQNDEIRVQPAPLHGQDIDVADIPDLVPILAVVAAFAQGITRLTNAARLRLKESDRISSVCAMLRLLGGTVEELPDALFIHGTGELHGGIVDSFADHRIAMAAAIAATRCAGPVTILGAECCAKSYPSFFADFVGLGGVADVLDDR